MTSCEIKKRPRRKLPNVCRICLTGSSSMSELMDEFDTDHWQNLTTLNVLENVMYCSVTISESTPNHICSMCLSLLRISYNLKKQFEESQRKLFGKLKEKNERPAKHDYDLPVTEKCNKAPSEVDIIFGKENYTLGDILIVEEEEKDSFNYSSFLENLGRTVTVEYLKTDPDNDECKYNKSSSCGIPDSCDTVENEIFTKTSSPSPTNEIEDEEYETILIQTVSGEETDEINSWEHEYAKSPTKESIGHVKKRGGRKSKYPTSLMEKINSLIIEGNPDDVTSVNTGSLNEESRSFLKGTPEQEPMGKKKDYGREAHELDKYIIFGSGEENTPSIQKENTTGMTSLPEEDAEQMVESDQWVNLENDDPMTSVKINEPIVVDQLLLEALNTKNLCSQCSLAFATRVSLKRHLRSVHGQKDVKKVPTKNQRLTKADKIQRRIERLKQRFKKNPMLCQLCGFVSKSAGGARYHSLTHGEKMYQCEICSKKFFTPSHLKNHTQFTHQAKKMKHLCPLCGEYRNSATALSYHIKLHKDEERKFSCPICGLKFIVKSALNNHIRRHNGDRRCPCTVCDKSFYSTNELKKHFMTHTGEKPYQCNYCDKRFVTPFNQKVHMMTHDGPFLCEYCHKGFIDIDMLNMHLKYKHRLTESACSIANQSDQEGDSNEAVILEELNLLPTEESDLYFEYDCE